MFSVVRQDRDAEGGEIAGVVGDLLESLDGGVEAFGRNVGDGVPEPDKVSRKVVEDLLGDVAEESYTP